MRILSVPGRRAGVAVMLVASAALVLRASAAAQPAQGLPACKGLSEELLNRWIGQANSRGDVVRELGRGRACVTAIGIKGLTPLARKLSLSASPGSVVLRGGALNVIKTKVSRNSGGGIASQGGGTVLVTDSQVTDNTFTGAGAGLINAGGGLMTVANSTVSGNRSDAVGGGIDNHFGGTTRVINSTVTGNTATSGGGLNNAAGGLLVSTNTTVKANKPDNCAGQIEGCP